MEEGQGVDLQKFLYKVQRPRYVHLMLPANHGESSFENLEKNACIPNHRFF
ncbi:unnamed protein product [Sphenostylis stenocarpa]|uniref:Uncharacterized protein n=1 Tax=Sphenostylis stenocarpa TaxID=92480 RepID=A0AA86V544_9FABA|nr:unnamed protein product [Sphenostylis stenocarpa]